MNMTTFATCVITFYGAVALVGVAFWLMFLCETHRYNLFRTTVILGTICTAALIPSVFKGLIITGFPKYFISFSMSVSATFGPIALVSIIVLKVMNAAERNKRLRYLPKDEDITKFYGRGKK